MTKKVIVCYDRSPDSSFMVHLCVGNSCWNAVQTEKNLLGCIWRSQTTIRRGNFDWHALKQCYTTLQSLWKWQIQYTQSTHLLVRKIWGQMNILFWANMIESFRNCRCFIAEFALSLPTTIKALERLLGWI